MRLTLIFPSVGRKEHTPYVRAWQMEPLSMAVLAGMTPPGFEVRFYDDRIEPIPFDEPTDLVAMSVETFTALRAYRIARQFRARGVPVVMGGYHVTLAPEEAREHADAIVLGDAEPVWRRVLDDARRRRLEPVYDGRGTRVLSGIRARRDLFAGKRYQNVTLVEFARGCNFKCDFCSITAFHHAMQSHRPADEVAEEMAATASRRFFIVDDNIVSQPHRVRELCRALIPLRIGWVGQASIHIAQDDELLELMVQSGCRGVLIGMESLDAANLRDMGKSWNVSHASYADSLANFRRHGLAVYGTFIFGYDNDDARLVERSVDFAREHKLFLAAFNHLIPFPGTPLYARLEAEGRLLRPRWWLDGDCRVGDVVFRPRRMSPDELQAACLAARRRFYSWPSIAARMWDRQANAQSALMLGVYLGLNASSHFDIDRRQGLRLGAGGTGSARGDESHGAALRDGDAAHDGSSRRAASHGYREALAEPAERQ
ncbi:MAG: B12-binding domain-containing radical SAM protein [Planctomycetota bacterium]|nr:MAG: B12-binding domain-containing radical SAM protein [Planctomycetota bacterium]